MVYVVPPVNPVTCTGFEDPPKVTSAMSAGLNANVPPVHEDPPLSVTSRLLLSIYDKLTVGARTKSFGC